MGWFGYKKQFNGSSNYHFRPRVGMGWFTAEGKIGDAVSSFRPRVGMGWFLIYCSRTNCTQIFK